MTVEEIKSRLQSVVETRYSHFVTRVKAPYCVFTVNDEKYGDDFTRRLCNRHVRIELYTAKKDAALESSIENLFPEVEISKDDAYIASESVLCTYIEFDVLYKLK